MLRPDAGDIIPGSGGLRKLRWSLPGKGKSGEKIRREEMNPPRVFNLKPVDVRAIRNKLGLSQGDFAAMIGVSVATLQNWEQGRRRPEGPAQALLKVAAANPQAG